MVKLNAFGSSNVIFAVPFGLRRWRKTTEVCRSVSLDILKVGKTRLRLGGLYCHHNMRVGLGAKLSIQDLSFLTSKLGH
jgi:hypothetical protein